MCEADTARNYNRRNLHEMCPQGLAVGEAWCVCSPSVYMQSVYVTNTTPLPSGQLCVWWRRCLCALLRSEAAPPLFLLTCVVILGDLSPCCHISIPHWNILILSSVQQPRGDWANIDLHCQWTPASLRERQNVVLYCGQSQHKIKVEQTVKWMWGVWFTQIHWLQLSKFSTTAGCVIQCSVGQLTRFFQLIQSLFHLICIHTCPCSSVCCEVLCCFSTEFLTVPLSVKQCGQNVLPLVFKVLF